MYKTVKCRLCSSFLFVRKPTQLGCHRFPVLFQIISGRTAKSRVISSRSERKLFPASSVQQKRGRVLSPVRLLFLKGWWKMATCLLRLTQTRTWSRCFWCCSVTPPPLQVLLWKHQRRKLAAFPAINAVCFFFYWTRSNLRFIQVLVCCSQSDLFVINSLLRLKEDKFSVHNPKTLRVLSEQQIVTQETFLIKLYFWWQLGFRASLWRPPAVPSCMTI